MKDDAGNFMGVLIGAVCMGVCVVALAAIWQALDRPITTVSIEGRISPSERDEVRQAISNNLDGGLLSLDIDVLRGAVKNLSWPRSVAVRRRWPGEIVVRVDRESIVAAWAAGGYVTSSGRITRLTDEVGELPRLSARFASPLDAMEKYLLLEGIAARENLTIVALEENDLGEWRAQFAGDVEVVLGREQVAQRMHRFLHTWRKLATRQPDGSVCCVSYVDTRYDTGVAVRFDENESPSGVAAAQSVAGLPAVGIQERF